VPVHHQELEAILGIAAFLVLRNQLRMRANGADRHPRNAAALAATNVVPGVVTGFPDALVHPVEHALGHHEIDVAVGRRLPLIRLARQLRVP
jgi:hypothetical protein